MTDAEILERLREHFQTKVNNLSGDEMAEGPFEDGTEDGELWGQAASRIDARGGLRVRFEFGDSAAEARPHNSEPLSLHTALAVGFDRGLRDLGAELSGCTPSMLTGHVINELKAAGLHPHGVDHG